MREESSGGRKFMRGRGNNPRDVGYGAVDHRQFPQRQQYNGDGSSWHQGRGSLRQFERFVRGQRPYEGQRYNRGGF